MKDVLIVHGIFDDRGGIQLRWRHLASELARTRRVTVLTWSPGWRPRSRTCDGYQVISAPCLVRWDRDRHFLIEMLNTAVSIVTGVVTALIVSKRWQVVLAVGLHPEGAVAGIAARVRRVPFLAEIWLVGPIGNVERLRRSRVRGPVLHVVRQARTVLSATRTGTDELLSLGFRPEQVRESPMSVDTSQFCVPTADQRRRSRRVIGGAGTKTIVYAGRFDLRQKHLALLIEAWREVSAPSWELVLVGDGVDRSSVIELAAKARGRIHVLGWFDDVVDALHGADAFVLPTRFENPGYALFEAMACGLPGIVSAIDVYRELAPDGVELVPNRVDAWAAALQRLVSVDAGTRAARGALARTWIEQHVATSAIDDLVRELDR